MMHLIIKELIVLLVTHKLCVLPRAWGSIVIHVFHPLHIIAFREIREFDLIMIRDARCHCKGPV